jgi:hypothetical protein
MSCVRTCTAAAVAALLGLVGGTAQGQWLHSIELSYVNQVPQVQLSGIWPVFDDTIHATTSFDGAMVRIQVVAADGGFSVVTPWELTVPLPPTGGGSVPIEVFYLDTRLGSLRALISDSRPLEIVFWNGFEP